MRPIDGDRLEQAIQDRMSDLGSWELDWLNIKDVIRSQHQLDAHDLVNDQIAAARMGQGLSSDKCAVDTATVVHAHWIRLFFLQKGCYECSNCGRYSTLDTNYCGSCGAKMDEVYGREKLNQIQS